MPPEDQETSPVAISHDDAIAKLNEAAALLQETALACIEHDNQIPDDLYERIYAWLERENLDPQFKLSELGRLELERLNIEAQIADLKGKAP